jgi:tetratricopeptide (TPR) repeat protein
VARRGKTPGEPDVLDEIESQGGAFAEWVQRHVRWVFGAVAGSLLAAAGWAVYSGWDARRETAASDALSAVESEYLAELGGSAGSTELPELANPEAARSVREAYLERFREVAEAHAGTAAGALARVHEAQVLSQQGESQQALELLRQTAAGLAPDAPLRGVVLAHQARLHEAAGQWGEAAEAHAAAGGIEGFGLRFWALADAARCFAQAGDRERAREIFDRLEAEAPSFELPAHLRELRRELRAAG